MRRRRFGQRTRRRLLVAALVLLVLLLGRGLGLLPTPGGGAVPRTGPGQQTIRDAVEDAIEDATRTAVRLPTELAAAVRHGAAPAPAAEVDVATTVVVAAPAPPSDPLVDDDRCGARLALIDHLLATDDVAQAAAALERMLADGLPCNPAATADRRAAVAAAVRREAAALVGELQAGTVLAARARLTRLLAVESSMVQAELAAMAAACGWPLRRSADGGGGELPEPALALRNRVVRTRLLDQDVTAHVVAEEPGAVTLRVVGPAGVRFPTVPLLQCEVVDASAGDAVEFALTALHAGDALLARLWLCCALARGAGQSALAPRVAAVSALLP